MRLRDCPTPAFTWHDLLIVYKYCDVESNLYRSLHPDKAGWTLSNHLLATSADVMRWLQWAKTSDGSKGINHPEPIPRPGVVGARKQVHPGAQGGPRSKIRRLLRRNHPVVETPDRATRLAKLFQTGS